jgi:hypothetical protein
MKPTATQTNERKTNMIPAYYFLTYSDAATLTSEVIEFDTYTEAHNAWKGLTLGGTEAQIHAVTSDRLLTELRKSPDYTDRRDI